MLFRSGTAGIVFAAATEFCSGDFLRGGGDCIFDGRAGEHSGLGGQIVFGMVFQDYAGSQKILASLLGGAAAGADDFQVARQAAADARPEKVFVRCGCKELAAG